MQKQQEAAREKMRELRGRMPRRRLGNRARVAPATMKKTRTARARRPSPGRMKEEGPSRDGKQTQPLSLDEAGRLLNMLRLDANRTLPLGAGDTAVPRHPNQRDW